MKDSSSEDEEELLEENLRPAVDETRPNLFPRRLVKAASSSSDARIDGVAKGPVRDAGFGVQPHEERRFSSRALGLKWKKENWE